MGARGITTILTLLALVIWGAAGYAGAPTGPTGSTGPAASPAAPEDPSFTIVALPDTQYYSQRLPAAYLSQTHWIAAHAKDLNIQAVIGLGDIVDDGSELSQWRNAMEALDVVKQSHVPFFLAPGNHDYNPPYVDSRPHARAARNFNANVGPAYYQDLPFYGGSMVPGSNENFWGTFHAAGRDYLVLVLEFSPRDAALAWASKVVEAHPNHDVIVVTHSYLFTDNTRITQCAAYSKKAYGLESDNDGEEIWRKFVIQHPNIRLVLAGHIPEGGVGRRFDVGVAGNLVNEILSDYQDEPNAGNGWLRVMTIHPAANRIDVQTYSPYLDEHPELKTEPRKRGPNNQFSLDYENSAQGRFNAGTIHGVVRVDQGHEICGPGLAGATVSYPGGSVTTDEEGRFTAVVSAASDHGLDPHQLYQAVNLTVTQAGYETVIHRAMVRDGALGVELIFVKPQVATGLH